MQFENSNIWKCEILVNGIEKSGNSNIRKAWKFTSLRVRMFQSLTAKVEKFERSKIWKSIVISKFENLNSGSWKFENLQIWKLRFPTGNFKEENLHLATKLSSHQLNIPSSKSRCIPLSVPLLSFQMSDLKRHLEVKVRYIYKKNELIETTIHLGRFDVNKSTRIDLYRGHRAAGSIIGKYLRDEIFNLMSRKLDKLPRGSYEPQKKMLILQDEDGHLATIALKYDHDYFVLFLLYVNHYITFNFNLRSTICKFEFMLTGNNDQLKNMVLNVHECKRLWFLVSNV